MNFAKSFQWLVRITNRYILGDPGANSRGERHIKRAKSVWVEAWCERKFTRRVGTSPGRVPLTDKFKSPFAFLLLVERKFWGIVFFCPISDQLVTPFLSWRLTQIVTLLNIVPRSHALVPTEINFLCRSFDRPNIEESCSNMRTQKVEKSRNLARVIKEKENKQESQIEALWKIQT